MHERMDWACSGVICELRNGVGVLRIAADVMRSHIKTQSRLEAAGKLCNHEAELGGGTDKGVKRLLWERCTKHGASRIL